MRLAYFTTIGEGNAVTSNRRSTKRLAVAAKANPIGGRRGAAMSEGDYPPLWCIAGAALGLGFSATRRSECSAPAMRADSCAPCPEN